MEPRDKIDLYGMDPRDIWKMILAKEKKVTTISSIRMRKIKP